MEMIKPDLFLTQEQVNELPDGTKIKVCWSGWRVGDFSEYIYKDGYAWMQEEFDKNEMTEAGWKGRELDFVGKDHVMTNVVLT